MSTKGHNKRRNVGLSYAFLVRLISSALVEGDQARSSAALSILKRHFKPGTELYKEFRLVNSLMKMEVSTPSVAASILTEAKSAARSHDDRKLEHEKSLLIRDINHKLNDDTFWDQPVPEYRMYATVQTLLNDWRSGTDAPLDRVAEYEERLVRWLSESRKKPEVLEELAGTTGENRLVVKLMMKRLNEKYGESLTPEQRGVLREYVFATSTGRSLESLKDSLRSVKQRTVEALDGYLQEMKNSGDPNKYMTDKLTESKQSVEAETLEEVTDVVITRFMLYMKLVSELGSKE